MILKDFQKAASRRIVELFCREGQHRVLLADEVGLGKTIIASDVIQTMAQRHRAQGNSTCFKVVYICSNINIAAQNCRKLGIPEEDCLQVSESRLSMQHLRMHQMTGSQQSDRLLIPMTPATSFSMTGGCGTQRERALMYAVLRRLPLLRPLRQPLSLLLQMEPGLLHWPEVTAEYEAAVTECNGHTPTYLPQLLSALQAAFQADPALPDSMVKLCRSGGIFSVPYRERAAIINRLRRIFAQISLDGLGPQLVIMDEFQRFRDLIAPEDSECGMLSRTFLQDPSTKVLLLSATPYKPYTTLEELCLGQESHHTEFLKLMDFLLPQPRRREAFHVAWSQYSHALSQLKGADSSLLLARKALAEQSLYQCVCRTERLSDSIMDRSKAQELDEVSEGDILSYVELQGLLTRLGLGRFPIDYVKSAPYLMSFMDYQIKERIAGRLAHMAGDGGIASAKTLFLRRGPINRYEKIPCNNARLQLLFDEAFGSGRNGAELMLWIPPARPYYKTNSVFSHNQGYSKILVFSSWEMVPRMIAGLTSYEAERLTIGRIRSGGTAKRYFAQEHKRRAVSRRLREDTQVLITYPSRYLAELYRPLEHLDEELPHLHRVLEERIRLAIDALAQAHGFSYKETGGAGQLLALLRLLDGDPDARPPKQVSRSAASLLAYMALGSPGVCALRVLKDPALSVPVAGEFVSLFSRPEAMAAMDVLYPTGDYYENVIQYCADGNLQSVLDEYAFTLSLSGRELADAMQAAFITTATTQVDTRESFLHGQRKCGLRTHFAVGYYDARISEKTRQRTQHIRCAFNSPFRPFVLATTSIGQEGLDFHTYCRKLIHWNLPANPIDLEQREGRVNRYLCHAIRQNLAESAFGQGPFRAPVWPELFRRAADAQGAPGSGLIPYWCLPETFPYIRKIERIVPMYPYSQDREKYDRLLEVLSLYRLTLGQPRQEELLETLKKAHCPPELSEQLYFDLSPYHRQATPPHK